MQIPPLSLMEKSMDIKGPNRGPSEKFWNKQGVLGRSEQEICNQNQGLDGQ